MCPKGLFYDRNWPERLAALAGRRVQLAITGSFRLDTGELDHLAPLLGLVGDELAEIGGRAGEHRAGQFGKPCLYLRIGKAALISLLSLSTISAGVLFGAPRPNIALAS